MSSSRTPISPVSWRAHLTPPATVVVKVGSRIVTPGTLTQKNRSRNYDPRVAALVRDIALLRRAGTQVVLVTSGAIAHGMQELHLTRRPTTLPMQQACASIGQIQLINTYRRLFARRGILTGQVLLTWDDLRNKHRYLNLRNTLFHLLECETVPIINENDSVGTDEIAFGDNDTLGSQISLLVNADLYVILTDVNGLYDAHPIKNTAARHIPVVKKIDEAIHAHAAGASSAYSVGGMVTKLHAAQQVNRAGIAALIGNGNDTSLVTVLQDETRGTLFLPAPVRLPARRRWLAFTRHASGTLTVDAGAARALISRGKSLLPAGVRTITGSFGAGDLVTIANESGKAVARGLSNFTSDEIRAISGQKTSELSRILGRKCYDEVVHRNNMVLLS